MHCLSCDKELSDFESSRKSKRTGEYLDLCNNCYKWIKDDIDSMENTSLISQQETIDLEEQNDEYE